jgi:hypothetical protein
MRLAKNIYIIPFFVLITACSFQPFITSPDEVKISTKTDLQCLNKIAGDIQLIPGSESLDRSVAPELIRIHGVKEKSSIFQPHITIKPNGMLVRQLPDSKQAFTTAKAESLNTSGLHIQLLENSDLPLDAAISDDQYSALAAQLAIWQVTHSIPNSHITTVKPSRQGNTTHDLQMRLDWEKLQFHKDVITEKCLLSLVH